MVSKKTEGTEPAKLAEKPTAKKLAKPAKKPSVIARLKVDLYLLRRWLRRHKIVPVILGILLLLAIGAAVWKTLQKPDTLSNDDMVVRVSRELQIQGDGNPAVLTVTDANKVTQPFLQDAQNGDKVLLYYKAGKSVLYRPSDDTIVRSGAFVPPDAKVFLRKGTPDDAKLEAVRQKVEGLQDVGITSQDASTKQDYTNTVVVDLTDRYNGKAQEIAPALGASVVRLPRGEAAADADILIIVGNQ